MSYIRRSHWFFIFAGALIAYLAWTKDPFGSAYHAVARRVFAVGTAFFIYGLIALFRKPHDDT